MPSRVSKLKRSGNKSEKKNRYQNNEVPIRVIYATQFEKCPFRVTSKSLRSYFEKAGSVERVDFINKSTHKFAFITYHNSEDAQKVLADPTFQQNMKIRKADDRHQPKNNGKKGNAEVDDDSSDNFRLLILNDDCLLYLFTFLNTVDAANLAETDDRIRLVSQMHFKKYSHFKSECLTFQKPEMISRVYKHIGPWITSLTFDPILSARISTDKMFEIFSKYCSNVETLAISNIEYRKKANTSVKKFCSKIKRMDMYNCNVDDSTIAELFGGSSHLEHFIIRDCDLITGKCLSKLTNLKTLILRSCSNLCENQLERGLRTNRLLTEYEIVRCDEILDFNGLKYFPNLTALTFDMYYFSHIEKLLVLNQLKKLKIISYKSIQLDSFLIKLGQKDMLEEFHINDLQIGERTLEAFKSFKKLKTLSLYSPFNNIKKMFFNRLSDVLPQLKSFKYHDSDITMDNIMSIIKHLKQLEYLDISCYGGVRMHEIGKIIDILKTNLNRPLFHMIVADNSFWTHSNWKQDPILLCNNKILEIKLKTSSDHSYGYDNDESDEFDDPDDSFDDSDDSDSGGENLVAMLQFVFGHLHNNINLNLLENVD